MTNSNSYQRNHWYEQLKELNGGDEFCNWCGKIRYSQTKNGTIQNDVKLVVDRIDNTNNHSIRDSTIDDFQMLCHSCNRRKDPRIDPDTKSNRYAPSSRPASREKIDRGMYEHTYNENLTNMLRIHEHLCMKEVEMGSTSLSEGGAIPTCKRYFDAKLKTLVNPKGIYQTFDYKCDSHFCMGVHVCLVGFPPNSLLTAEKELLHKRWKKDFGNLRETWNNHTATINKPFMEFEEYLEANAQLLNHEWQ